MKNIANDGTYQLSQPGQPAVGYLVAVGAMQHWVLGPNYAWPGKNHPRVELTFTLVDERPYSEAEVRELHRRIAGSCYIYADVSTQDALPPVAADEDIMPPATALSVGEDDLIIEVVKKQIDPGCHKVIQGDSAVGVICVSGGTTQVEAWRLATSDDVAAPGDGLAVMAFRPIGRTPTTLTFQWLDDGATPPSDEHRQLDEALSRTNALQLFAVCRDRSDAPAKASAAQ